MVEQLKLEERGYIDSDLMPPVMVVHDSMREVSRAHLRQGQRGGGTVGGAARRAGWLLEVAKEVAAWAKSVKANVVVGVTGAPSRKRGRRRG